MMKGQQICSAKGQMVNIVNFVAHMVSIATNQLSCHSTKEVTHNIKMNRWGCVAVTLNLPKQRVCWIWPTGCSSPIPEPKFVFCYND